MKGIQVGSAPQNCNIYDNTLTKYSQANISGFQGGILNNPGSVCNIYRNFIQDGIGTAIILQGNGNNQIYDNQIINAGQDGTGGHGIIVLTGSNPGNSIYIWRNTIITPKNYGINYYNTKGAENRIENNRIVAPGNYAAEGQKAYIQIWGLKNVTVSNNLFQ